MPKTTTDSHSPAKKKESKSSTSKTLARPSQLSAEFVQDSDDSVEPTITKKAQATKPAKKTKAISNGASQSQASSKSSLPIPKLPPKKKRSPPRSLGTSIRDISEPETDSDIASDNEKGALSTKATPPPNKSSYTSSQHISSKTLARPSSNSTSRKERTRSDSFSSQRSSSIEHSKSKNVKTTKKGERRSRSADSKSESDSDRQSELVESGDDEGSTQATAGAAQPSSSPDKNTIPPFEPPAGFEAASIAIAPSSEIAKILCSENLEGKQVWHITVPASVPISSVEEVSAQSIQDGSSMLTHKGESYGLVSKSENNDESKEALLLPSSRNNDYRPCQASIINTLHLQQLVKFPMKLTASRSLANHSTVGNSEPVRPRNEQPQGMKMRFHPFGLPSDSESDSTAPTTKPQFKHPILKSSQSQPKKRKRTESNDHAQESDLPVAKHKKVKTQSSPTKKSNAEVASAKVDDDDLSSKDPETGKTASKKMKNVESDIKSTANRPNGVESKEDRAKRKAEKTRLKLSHDTQSVSSSKSAATNGIKKHQGSPPRQPEQDASKQSDHSSVQKPEKAKAKSKKPKEEQKPPPMPKATPSNQAFTPFLKPIVFSGFGTDQSTPARQLPESLSEPSDVRNGSLTQEEHLAKEERKKKREEKRRKKEAQAARLAG